MVIRMSGGACYVLTIDELATLVQTNPESAQLERVLPQDRTPLLFPDLPLDTALRHLARWPLLPVQNRAAKGTLEGMVTLEDVLERYQRG